MALQKNRQIVVKLLRVLEPRVLGQKRTGFSCNCGAISYGPAEAVCIDPAGDTYPGQETLWSLWSVRMSPHLENTGTHDYSIGLDAFIPAKELKAMFKRYFDDQEDK